MQSSPPPGRFSSTVAFYGKYRLAYPQRLIARLVALTALAPGDRVLDLGCGPASLAIPFARAGMAVTALDPDRAMLAAAQEVAAAEGLAIDFQQRGSGDLTPADGPFQLITIGRAFHWMDRAATLEILEKIVTPDGGVALFHDAHPPVAENDWFKIANRIGDRCRAQAAQAQERGASAHRRYEPFLYASAFTRLDGLSVTVRRPITVDEIVGRAFSTSVCSKDALGARAPAFETDLRAALWELSSDGSFIEIAELVALLARRPQSGQGDA